jgi:hypothetical protein
MMPPSVVNALTLIICCLNAMHIAAQYVPPPLAGLGDRSNYFIYSDGDVLRDVQVQIQVEQDVVSQTSLSFQLNCWAPPTVNLPTVWQQFFFAMGAGTNILQAFVELSQFIGSESLPTVVISSFSDLVVTSNIQTVPAGLNLFITLTNDDDGFITGVNFEVTTPEATFQKTLEFPADLYNFDGTTPSASNLSPTVGLQFNVVGAVNSEFGDFTSGLGYVTFSATNELTPLNFEPGNLAFQGATNESSNMIYGPMENITSTVLTQVFSV